MNKDDQLDFSEFRYALQALGFSNLSRPDLITAFKSAAHPKPQLEAAAVNTPGSPRRRRREASNSRAYSCLQGAWQRLGSRLGSPEPIS
ncbi:hypothetical protein NUW58_g9762 [Xylaria curta]|uniref:Uncharacterized protein n=1 Tax=Xylaria curta TaxID=42375 RepID=A0ACC1MU79_9PEZI|nr:hypothetical protein NUW58_g9762 [Xylaria curta]